jgi:hypothetical protein
MRHTIILPKIALKTVPKMLLALSSFLLFSYSPKMGSDSFSIYINNALIVEQFVAMNEPVKSINLSKYAANDEVSVRYNHCGHPGKQRTVVLKDSQGNTLKEWQFQDGKSIKDAMSFKVKEVLAFQDKSGEKNLKLYYFSKELPEGKMLATISTSKDKTIAYSSPLAIEPLLANAMPLIFSSVLL